MRAETTEMSELLVEGLARCVNNEALPMLEIGEIVYVRELSNLRGHCIVLANNRLPIVGYHLDRFELLDDSGDHIGLIGVDYGLPGYTPPPSID